MGAWTIQGKLPKLSKPILIEGLPGIGNVGKVAADFLIMELKAKKVMTFFSHSLPHTVFVQPKNLVKLPELSLYHTRVKSKDVLLLAGDVQPVDEQGCYTFCEELIALTKHANVQEIVTLGGIGLHEAPEHPKVYCAGSIPSIVSAYKKIGLKEELYGVVGPIIGITGVLVGIAGQHNIPAVALLAETHGHPMAVDPQGAAELVKVLQKRFGFSIDAKKLQKPKQDDAAMLAGDEESHEDRQQYIG